MESTLAWFVVAQEGKTQLTINTNRALINKRLVLSFFVM